MLSAARPADDHRAQLFSSTSSAPAALAAAPFTHYAVRSRSAGTAADPHDPLSRTAALFSAGQLNGFSGSLY